MVIRVHSEDFEIDHYHATLSAVIEWICKKLKLKVRSIDLIFISDNELKDMHQKYLGDDSYSDVMTFNLSDNQFIESEIYVSLERAKIQAAQFTVSLINEICRLCIHACLHLAGFDDQYPEGQILMKRKEDSYIKEVENRFLIH